VSLIFYKEKNMEKNLNTTIEFEFCDGTTAKMTLFFYALYQLKNKNKALYDRYNKVMTNQAKGIYDELEMITLLYVAYVCANLDEENLMSEEEFIMKCGADRKAVAEAAQELTSPKKAKASGKPS
jgi:hypothetical protein